MSIDTKRGTVRVQLLAAEALVLPKEGVYLSLRTAVSSAARRLTGYEQVQVDETDAVVLKDRRCLPKSVWFH